jgi:hypothetical protein
MSDTAAAVQAEIDRRRVADQAAAHLTRGNLALGWKLVIAGWLMPIIPILGFFLMIPAAIAGGILGIVAAHKGNLSGGSKLMFTAWLGTALVGVLWVGIYALIASLR